MHANVSLWKVKNPDTLDKLLSKAEAELMPKLRDQRGFVHFEIIVDKETLVLIHTWESKEASDKGIRPLVPWLLKNAATKLSLISRHGGSVPLTTLSVGSGANPADDD